MCRFLRMADDTYFRYGPGKVNYQHNNIVVFSSGVLIGGIVLRFVATQSSVLCPIRFFSFVVHVVVPLFIANHNRVKKTLPIEVFQVAFLSQIYSSIFEK